MKTKIFLYTVIFCLLVTSACSGNWKPQLPANRWVQIAKDPVGARRGRSIRYAPDAGAFFLWGFMNADPDLLQEQPLMVAPEYDVVYFDPSQSQWRSHLPRAWELLWNKRLPLAYTPRTYSGITTGSERTVLRGATSEEEGAPRPDLNIVFDQVTYHPASKSLIYFTGGLTAAYNVMDRRWSDLVPSHSPPPVLGGSLAYDSINDEIILFGGGHVAEAGSDGRVVGYTGTWVYRFQDKDWRPAPADLQPPPRMNMRVVCDSKNQVLVLFGGDAQSHYLADTWLYDLKTRKWRASKSPTGPEARAGHFTVYDPETGWVLVGGGYNHKDLTDMWAYDAVLDRWQRLAAEVPTGFYLAADIAPDKRMIVLVTNTRRPGDTMSCNILYPVRTTYGFRIEKESLEVKKPPSQAQQSISKRPEEATNRSHQDAGRKEVQLRKLQTLPVNQWIHLSDPGRMAPTRTWGSATFDTDLNRILYWGGGHCGYEGNDVDAYDVEAHSWYASDSSPEYPERLWNHGVRPAGVTFQRGPWTEHGRRVYAYDPVSRRMIMARTVRLTTGYDPAPLKLFPSTFTSDYQAAHDALVYPPSSYVKYVTWTYDPHTGQWHLAGGAPPGLDTLVTTRHGVMGVNVNWPSRLNDAGYLRPWNASMPPEDKAIFLFDAKAKDWTRLSHGQPSPQNLYEMTSLAYDSKRDQVILHGGGEKRDELWVFEMAARRWKKMEPRVAPPGAMAPTCAREAVYLPRDDVFLIYGIAGEQQTSPAVWVYKVDENSWYRADLPPVPGIDPRFIGQNRAMVYDQKHDVVLLVLGARGDEGKATVYALRYRHDEAKFHAVARR